jgi:hypothetical protein
MGKSFKLSPLETFIHIGITEVIVNTIWWGIGKWGDIEDANIKGWGFLVFSVIGLVAVLWYLGRKLDRKYLRQKENIEQIIEPIKPNAPIDLDGFSFSGERKPIQWFKNELQNAREVWCLWFSGGNALNNGLLESGKIKKIVLTSPNETDMINKLGSEAWGEKPNNMVENILRLTEICRNKIEVRWWEGLSSNVMVFFNPNDDDAKVLIDLKIHHLTDDQRPQIIIWKSRMPDMYKRLRVAYDYIWEKSDKTLIYNQPKLSN